jgi:hypothetical protein
MKVPPCSEISKNLSPLHNVNCFYVASRMFYGSDYINLKAKRNEKFDFDRSGILNWS